ncbi:copper homeostasis protein CutC [Bacillus sp. 165]|nr:copper homeostasis protein CutC [Bacillus sp. 165]
MKLEVISTCVQDAIDAEQFGANRIELVTGIKEGGVTPSFGTIRQVMQHVTIPVHVMIRPHSRSFCYSETDVETMIEDIKMVKDLGAQGVVFGALTNQKEIDVKILERLISVSGSLQITFHRAFDETNDMSEALRIIKQYRSITRILTSGGRNSVLDGKERVQELVKQTIDTHLTILAGSGLTIETVKEFIANTGVQEVHFGSGVRCNGQSLEQIEKKKMSLLLKQLQDLS